MKVKGNVFICDGGEKLECILFGDVIENFIKEEIDYIFNLYNWTKDYKSFRESYLSIRKSIDKPLTVSKQLMRRYSKIRRVIFCGNKRDKF